MSELITEIFHAIAIIMLVVVCYENCKLTKQINEILDKIKDHRNG